MTEYQMAEFFRSLGHKTVQTESCFWYSSQRFLYKNLPIHRNVDPSRAELAKVMLRGTALVVRYPGTPGDDATADGDRFAAQGRVEQLLDRCIEGIEVCMEDGGCRFHPDRSPVTFRGVLERRT